MPAGTPRQPTERPRVILATFTLGTRSGLLGPPLDPPPCKIRTNLGYIVREPPKNSPTSINPQKDSPIPLRKISAGRIYRNETE